MTQRLLALVRVDLRAAVRDNEQLLLTIGIPAVLLIFFSTISASEISIKNSIGKLPLPEPPATYIPKASPAPK